MAPNCGIVITDLTAMVGDCMRSFVEIAKDALFPMWYWGLAESDQHAAWLQDHLLDVIIQEVRENKLGNLPKDDYQHGLDLPTKPTLLQCVWGGSETTATIHIAPQDLVKWKIRDDDIQKFSGQVKTEWGVDTLMQEPTTTPNVDGKTPSDGKRAAPGTDENPSPGKHQRTEEPAPPVSEVKTVPIASVTDKVLVEMKLTQAPQNTKWELHLLVGNKIVLVNNDSSTQTLPAGFTLMGFGKGKWTQLKTGQEHGEKDVPFQLTDETSKVLFNGAVAEVGTLLSRQAVANPAQAKVCYHDLVETPRPGKPSAFQLKQKIRVATQSLEQLATETADGPAKLPWNCGAAVVEVRALQACEDLEILFTMKWIRKGLQPTAPLVTLKNAVSVPGGHAYVLK